VNKALAGLRREQLDLQDIAKYFAKRVNLEETKETFQEKLNELDNKVSTNIESSNEEYDTKLTELESSTNTKISNLETSTNSKISELEDDTNTKLDNLETSTDNKISELDKTISEKLEKTSLLEILDVLSNDEMANLGITNLIIDKLTTKLVEYIVKSDNVTEEYGSIDVTESNGTEYNITPSKGYISVDGKDVLVYQHPLYHNANEIQETYDRKFTSVTQQALWNSKVDATVIDDAIASVNVNITESLVQRLSSINTRIEEIEKQVSIDTMESNRKELISDINASLSLVAKKYEIIGDGTNSLYTINHNLNTKELQPSVVDLSTGEIVYPTIIASDNNNIQVRFSNALENGKTYVVYMTSKKNIVTIYNDVNNLSNSICSRYTFVTDGYTTSYNIEHNLGTKNLQVSLYEVASNSFALGSIVLTDENNITINFDGSQDSGSSYYVYITAQPELVNTSENEIIESIKDDVNDVLKNICREFSVSSTGGKESETLTVNHNMNTEDIQVSVYETSTDEIIYDSVTIKDENNIEIYLENTTEETYRVIITACDTVTYTPLEQE
jgi:hypothetical protein